MKISIDILKNSLCTTATILYSLLVHLNARFPEQNIGYKSLKKTQERDMVNTWHEITEYFAECQLLGTLTCFGRITVTKF